MRKMTDAQGAALDTVLDLDSQVWFDVATSLSCTEVEAIADLLDQFGAADGKAIIAAHAEDDDEGDKHVAVYDDRGVSVGYTVNNDDDMEV